MRCERPMVRWWCCRVYGASPAFRRGIARCSACAACSDLLVVANASLFPSTAATCVRSALPRVFAAITAALLAFLFACRKKDASVQ